MTGSASALVPCGRLYVLGLPGTDDVSIVRADVYAPAAIEQIHEGAVKAFLPAAINRKVAVDTSLTCANDPKDSSETTG
jgi:hypothetical protein